MLWSMGSELACCGAKQPGRNNDLVRLFFSLRIVQLHSYLPSTLLGVNSLRGWWGRAEELSRWHSRGTISFELGEGKKVVQ